MRNVFQSDNLELLHWEKIFAAPTEIKFRPGYNSFKIEPLQYITISQAPKTILPKEDLCR